MRILFLSAWFPFPAHNGSKLRIYNLLRGLAEQHDVTLITFADRPDIDPESPELRAICREIKVIPWKEFEPESRQARLGFFSLTPRSVVDTYSPAMAACIETTLAAAPFDIVIASQIKIAGYRDSFGGVPAIFEEVEVGVMVEQFRHAATLARRLRYGLTWFKHRRYLAQLLSGFQASTVVSPQERRLLHQVTGRHSAPAVVIPNCIDLTEYAPVARKPVPNTLIFTGSFSFFANYDAMRWFVGEVYPIVLAQVPGVCLRITGDHGGKPLPPAPNVELTGFVDDIRPLVANAWLSLAPLLAGGGTRLKILEAMALGTPVVATGKGAEGLDVKHDEHLLLADTPAAFAAAVVRLLQEPGLRMRLARNAHALVSRQYDWTAVMPRFLRLVEDVAIGQHSQLEVVVPNHE